jgi:serine/threonine protein kinase
MQAKLGDFGCARRLLPSSSPGGAWADEPGRAHYEPDRAHREPGRAYYEPGAIAGTPIYMAPEQLAGAPRLCAGADVWALGVLAHEILTGRYPWRVYL